MSRVYQALEKAEREREERIKQDPLPRAVEDLAPPKQEKAVVSHPSPPAKRETPDGLRDFHGLIAIQDSYGAEQFRKLKTQIFHGSSNSPRLILVTSTVPGEGKTLVSVNLAATISQEVHKKCILIDADLRKPSIPIQRHDHLKGLSTYLQGQISLGEILTKPGEEDLWVIGAGPSSNRSTELIGSRRMKELLVSLREDGEETYVILDSPPVHATSDPIVLSRMVDGIVFVTRAGRSPKELVKRAIGSLERDKILGVVLNEVDLKPMRNYSRYYSGYYYGHYKK